LWLSWAAIVLAGIWVMGALALWALFRRMSPVELDNQIENMVWVSVAALLTLLVLTLATLAGWIGWIAAVAVVVALVLWGLASLQVANRLDRQTANPFRRILAVYRESLETDRRGEPGG
jgi:hypothetical protein